MISFIRSPFSAHQQLLLLVLFKAHLLCIRLELFLNIKAVKEFNANNILGFVHYERQTNTFHDKMNY